MYAIRSYYDPVDVLIMFDLPENAQYAGMIMNNNWLKHKKGLLSRNELKAEVVKLAEIAPKNEYIAFNNLFLTIDDEIDDANQNSIQNSMSCVAVPRSRQCWPWRRRPRRSACIRNNFV